MKQSERSEATQTRLLAVARELFGSQGYEATSIDDLVGAAGVTKGAFYHHFVDKRAIFRRVYEGAVRDVTEKVHASAVHATCAIERARAGCRAFLEACLDPMQQRIGLDDGPKVLGWATMREIQWSYSLALFEAVFEEAMAEGSLVRRAPVALAHLFFGALCEASVYIARAARPQVALVEVMRELDEIMTGLVRPGREALRRSQPAAAPDLGDTPAIGGDATPR